MRTLFVGMLLMSQRSGLFHSSYTPTKSKISGGIIGCGCEYTCAHIYGAYVRVKGSSTKLKGFHYRDHLRQLLLLFVRMAARRNSR